MFSRRAEACWIEDHYVQSAFEHANTRQPWKEQSYFERIKNN
jgi:hypothetical protein